MIINDVFLFCFFMSEKFQNMRMPELSCFFQTFKTLCSLGWWECMESGDLNQHQ